MKYCQYLKALDSDAPEEWQGKFLGYKKLKKAIKNLSRVQAECEQCKENQDAGPRMCQQEAAFFDQLHREVLAVNREFAKVAKHVIKLAEKDNQKTLSCCLNIGICRSIMKRKSGGEIDLNDLVAKAEWCRRYAQINSVGLRKIVKKHDKICKNKAGHIYMQEVWSGHKRMYGTFLHSPLLEELKSLETILMREVARRRKDMTRGACLPSGPSLSGISEIEMSACPESGPMSLPMLPSIAGGNTAVAQHFEKPGPSAKGDSAAVDVRLPEGTSQEVAKAVSLNEAAVREVLQLNRVSVASSGLSTDEEIDPDHQCPICLEAMYQPLGLECGHKFCADCAFSAVGKAYALGTVRAILDHVHPEAACPECRTHGVFVFAIELKETEKLIKQRYPKAWAERAEEAHKKQAHLRELLAMQRQRQHLASHLLF